MHAEHVDQLRQSFEKLDVEDSQPMSENVDNVQTSHQSSKQLEVQVEGLELAVRSKIKSGGTTSVQASSSTPYKFNIRLPNLPRIALTGDHYYGFGWDFDDVYVWLYDYSADVLKHSDPSGLKGFAGLREKLKYSGLQVFPTPWQQNDVVSKCRGLSDGKERDAPYKCMLTITYTVSKDLFLMRPSAKTFEKMKKLFPGEPRWAPDYFPKNKWHLHPYVWF